MGNMIRADEQKRRKAGFAIPQYSMSFKIT